MEIMTTIMNIMARIALLAFIVTMTIYLLIGLTGKTELEKEPWNNQAEKETQADPWIKNPIYTTGIE